ncbi:MAG TPA: hypothetical protein VNZ25_07175, partial [Candidatus Angelobacter sp.]|nr:hypothetical protein [Candidatus Angelobacter sp.]
GGRRITGQNESFFTGAVSGCALTCVPAPFVFPVAGAIFVWAALRAWVVGLTKTQADGLGWS